MLLLKQDLEVVLAQSDETMKRDAEEQKDISARQTQVRGFDKMDNLGLD